MAEKPKTTPATPPYIRAERNAAAARQQQQPQPNQPNQQAYAQPPQRNIQQQYNQRLQAQAQQRQAQAQAAQQLQAAQRQQTEEYTGLSSSKPSYDYGPYTTFSALPTSVPIQLSPNSQHPPRSNSAMSSASHASGSSSLMERRRGREKAEGLKELKLGQTAKKGQGWKVVGNPNQGGGQNVGLGAGAGGGWNAGAFDGAQMPISPSPWQLTPKKMGDDLFLTIG
jgi:hypothetical protein